MASVAWCFIGNAFLIFSILLEADFFKKAHQPKIFYILIGGPFMLVGLVAMALLRHLRKI